MENSTNHAYDDIINLPCHVSAVHPHMAVADRAAQFSPFAALTGYGDAIKETGRLTDTKAELTEDAKEILDGKLKVIQEQISACPEVSVTYFCSDEKKAGGFYTTVTGCVKKTDEHAGEIVMEDGMKIPVEDVIDLRFDSLEISERSEHESDK